MIERLEERALLTVSLDANGWTQVTPTPNVSTQIYVSSSTGLNSNDGKSPSTPVATIAHALTLIHNNAPDWVMLKRGDTFSEAVTLNTSGADAQDPMVFTSYGSTSLPRPVVDSGSSIALSFGTHLDHYVDVIGISFTSSTADPSSPKFTNKQTYGLDDLGTSDVLVEDCSFRFFIDDLVIQGTFGPVSNVNIRRNEILDAYSTVGHAEGLYAESVSNLTISENIFDHDGWNTTAVGGGATGYNHDAYIHSSCSNCVITGNVFAEASATGLQARAGGVVDNNLFVNDPYGLIFGLVNGATTKAGGVTGEANGNVIIEPRVDTINSFGIGMQVGNLKVNGDTVISNNIVAAGTAGVPSYFFTPGNGVSNVAQEAGLNSLTFSNNTSYNWGYGLNISSLYVDGTTGANGLTDLAVINNRFQGNLSGRILVHGNAYGSAQETWSGNIYNSTTSQSSWFSLHGATTSLANWKAAVEPTAVAQALPFADPTRTIETYMASLGQSPTLAAYVAGLRSMSKTNWNPAYVAASVNSYIQAGFSTGVVNPTIALTGKSKANSGGTYTLHLGAVNDPGQTVSQYTVNWGDGSAPDTYTTAGDVTHSYSAAGPATITVDLTDGNGTHTGAGTLAVSVSQPTLGLSGNAAAFVGQAYSLTINPSGDLGGTPQQFTINWGDGTSSMYAGKTTNVVATHVYADAQSANITADLVDDTGTFLAAGSTAVSVVPATSVALDGASSTNVGVNYTLTLSSDVDPAGTVSSFVVHWGDNTTSTPTSLGDFTHIYQGTGAKNVVVDTVDENGTFLNAGSLALTVNQPAITLSGNSLAGLNQPYTLTLSNPVDPNETITGYTIHWGDGQTDTPSAIGDFQHTYTTSGSKKMTVDITDGLGTYTGAGTLSVVVPTVPTLTPAGNANANAGGKYSLTLGPVTDINGTPSQYLVHWGDGSTSTSSTLTTLTHTYGASAAETISVDVTDPSGTYAAVGRKNITVNAAPKIALGGAATATTNVSYSLTLGAVTDPGYTATKFTIHWGDGTTSTATAVGVVKHTYTAAVNATITVDLTDSTGTFAGAGSLKVAVTAPLFTKSIDIGAPGVAGSASYSAGVYTVTGAGTDFVSTSDKFHFDYTTVTGNKTIAAQVTSLTNTASLAKAGVMFRNGTAANAAFADMAVTPTGELEFQWRTTAGGAVSKSTLTGQAIPRWIKLVRTGSSFAAWYSSDGKTWKQLGTSHTISMTTVNAGLAVTSLVTTKAATAKFANVSLV